MKYPLMKNNILREDLDVLIEYLKQDDPMLTQSKNVALFEEEWSKWLGVNRSVFVNSGASANLLTMAILRIIKGDGGEVIVPPLTWVSDIASVIQNGFTPVFADINPRTLGMDTHKILAKITDKTKAVFLSHIQGFNALSDELIFALKSKDIALIEDVCESHGAEHNGKKAGSFGLISNFSFYYAHHMSTIEGGMICTNDEDVYQAARMLRSHGMLRESSNFHLKEAVIKNNPELNSDFIFMHAAYNVRNNELGGLLGRSQLKRLDEIVKKRTENFKFFQSLLNEKKFFVDFLVEGSSNYAFNVVLRENDYLAMDRLMAKLKSEGIEFRRGSAGGGNQLRQPYLKDFAGSDEHKNYPNTEHIHFFGMYIGNYPELGKQDISYICNVLNG